MTINLEAVNQMIQYVATFDPYFDDPPEPQEKECDDCGSIGPCIQSTDDEGDEINLCEWCQAHP